ncbi:hypothetical protein [Psychroserpens sp.]|uniref:hypothetical protein n=1 Tax=Psychroserpens sp. TaxID=2020870 RepID=UPI00385BD68C
MKNQTGKYLKYAIGEILLVVVGILIAVQINSFVNSRQLKTDNQVFLKKMITDLELNKKRLNRLMFGDKSTRYISLQKAIRNDSIALRMTYNGLKASDLDYFLNNNLGAGGSYLNLHKSTYEELLNTGKLYTLGSEELITAIKNYNKRCEREDLYNKANTKGMNDGYLKLEKGLNKISMDYYMDSENFNINNYPWYFDKQSELYQNMQLGLADMHGGQANNFYKMGELIKYSDSLIVIINKELDK